VIVSPSGVSFLTRLETHGHGDQWRIAVLEDVARNLRRLRRERDLAQAQVARLAGIRQQQLSEIEHGWQPPLALVERLARVLCVHPNELLRDAANVERDREGRRATHEQPQPVGTTV